MLDLDTSSQAIFMRIAFFCFDVVKNFLRFTEMGQESCPNFSYDVENQAARKVKSQRNFSGEINLSTAFY